MSVYCLCGAQWHGKFVDSPVITDHRYRHLKKQGQCAITVHEVFMKRFKCGCSECSAKRRARWREKHASKMNI